MDTSWRIVTDKDVYLVDEPVQISLASATEGSIVEEYIVVVTRMADEKKVRFFGWAVFRVAQMPRSRIGLLINQGKSIAGSYTGICDMGLFSSMVQEPEQLRGCRFVNRGSMSLVSCII